MLKKKCNYVDFILVFIKNSKRCKLNTVKVYSNASDIKKVTQSMYDLQIKVGHPYSRMHY